MGEQMPLTGVNPPKNLSASSIGSLKQCPLLFKYRKIDRLPEEPSEALVGGSFVHAILESLFKLPAEERTLESARHIARAEWNKEWKTKAHAAVQTKEGRNKFRWNAWWAVENYFKMEDPTQINPQGVEFWVRGPLAGVPMVGIIDRWHKDGEEVVITDYKTGKFPQKRFQDEKVFQMMIYVVMLEDKLKAEVDRAELLFVSAGKVMTVKPTDELREQTKKETKLAWDEVLERCSTGDFPPRTSKLCDYCSFKNICPAWN